MTIHLAKFEPDRVGGGWSFAKNFVKGLGQSDYDQADVYLIPSPSMVQRDEVAQAKADGKKIILRIDNVVRNSRNRNTGMTRMKDFADMADLVIFQSNWAKGLLESYIQKEGKVILNGADLNVFTNQGNNSFNKDILYSRFNRDETKNWEVARYWYSRYQIYNPDSKLFIIGQFSDELKQGNFDFYNNEKYEYLGVLDEYKLAKVYAISQFLYTYYNDACSNSLIEALVSGCRIVGDQYYLSTGGARELIDAYIQKGRNYLSMYRMCQEYQEVISELL